MLSKRYESTEVNRRTWLHVPSGTHWSTSSGKIILLHVHMKVTTTSIHTNEYRAVSLIVFYLHFCQNWDMHIVGIVRTRSISSYTLKLNQK